MPRRSLTPCTVPGCPELVNRPGPCPQHSAAQDRARQRHQPWRAYGGDWPRIRARVLREAPLCANCGARADDVDHIVPLRDGGDHRRSNLQPLCRRCHNRKTTEETHRGGDPSTR